MKRIYFIATLLSGIFTKLLAQNYSSSALSFANADGNSKKNAAEQNYLGELYKAEVAERAIVKNYRVKNIILPYPLKGCEVTDFDHDGKLDFAVSKRIEDFSIFEFYKNRGKDYIRTDISLDSEWAESFKFADFNNDGYVDVVSTGPDKDYNLVTKIYHNDKNNLVEKQVMYGSNKAAKIVADFNGDGALDFVSMGLNDELKSDLKVYWNDKKGKFKENIIPVEGLFDSTYGNNSMAAGDINNDGYYDFAVAGYNGKETFVYSYIYDPSTHTFIQKKESSFENLRGKVKIELQDYNKDNNLDIIVYGKSAGGTDTSFVKIIKNQDKENSAPTAPVNFSTRTDDENIYFNWEGAKDDKTPEASLQYELKVGSIPGKSDIAKYTVSTPFWFLSKDKLPYSLYWSVKTIDATNLYSESSVEQQVSTISAGKTATRLEGFKVYPNPVMDKIILTTPKEIKGVNLIDMKGTPYNVELDGNEINVSRIPKGMYLLQVKFEDEQTHTEKIIKR